MVESRRRREAKATLDPERLARLCHALSDPTRIGILERLRAGERCVCDLMDLLDAAQSRLSFHLKTLRDAGLVRDRRDGRWVHYSLDFDSFAEIESFLAAIRAARTTEGKTCCGS